MNMNNLISVYSTKMEEIGKGFVVNLGNETSGLIASPIDKVIESLYHLYHIDNNIVVLDNTYKNRKELEAALVNLKLIKVVTNIEKINQGERIFRSNNYINCKIKSQQGRMMVIVE